MIPLIRSTVLWTGAFAIGAALAMQSLSFVSAAPGEPTYAIRDISIEYPALTQDGTIDPGAAELSYSARWTVGHYPGPALCEFRLYDDAGNVVGTAQIEYSSATSAPPRSTDLAVEVSAPPSRAEGECARGSNVRGRGYEFRHTATSAVPGHSGVASLEFEARRVSDLPPGQRRCEIVVTQKGGSSETFGPITVFVVDPVATLTFEVPLEPTSIAAARVACTDL